MGVSLEKAELLHHTWNIVLPSWSHMLRVALPSQSQGDSAVNMQETMSDEKGLRDV